MSIQLGTAGSLRSREPSRRASSGETRWRERKTAAKDRQTLVECDFDDRRRTFRKLKNVAYKQRSILTTTFVLEGQKRGTRN